MNKIKLALGIQYNGSQYSGWQRQKHALSIQTCLEVALSKIANEKIEVYCAGRTDAGVHALEQIIHFETSSMRALNAWIMGTNSHLPLDISVKWAKEVDLDFHARFSAKARTYFYFIDNSLVRTALFIKNVTYIHHFLDEKKMHDAAQYLLGEHDFSAFRSSQCQSLSSYRNVHQVSVERHSQYIIVKIKANAFLHHMVRNIVGSLIEIGKKKQPIDWLNYLLQGKDRTKSAATALPNGLYLAFVDYPEKYALPVEHNKPILFF